MQADAPLASPVSVDALPVVDALLSIERERRTGSFVLRADDVSGEAHFVDGALFDVVHGRHEGMKALARLVDARTGTHQFTAGGGSIARRLHGPTHVLVVEAKALAVRASTLLSRAGELLASTLLAVEATAPDASEIDRHVLEHLRAPATLESALESLPHLDAAILESALRLHDRGLLRNLGKLEQRVRLCGADQLHLVRASASRAQALGFAGPARIVFAATPARLAVFSHTVLSLSDARAADETAPSQPVPFTMAVLHLGDGVDLEIVGLPLVPAYAPLWPMALGGVATVVKLDEASAAALEETCTSVGVPILDARAIFGVLEETSAVQVASLIKTALDAEGISVR